MICIQLKIKCKTILLKTLENGLNKSYFMTYQDPNWYPDLGATHHLTHDLANLNIRADEY